MPTDRDRVGRLVAAEQDERRRIALFLHDGPVQHLSGIALMLDAAIRSSNWRMRSRSSLRRSP